jgi:hypothetical protein
MKQRIGRRGECVLARGDLAEHAQVLHGSDDVTGRSVRRETQGTVRVGVLKVSSCWV